MNPMDKQDILNKLFLFYGSKLVYMATSPFQTIYVTERSEFGGIQGKFRMLQFSFDAIQGIMNLEQPQSLVTSYCRIAVDLIDHYAPDFKKGFIIGHGIGTVSSYYSEKYFLTAEIDPVVVEVSKTYFGHTGKNVEVSDGQALLKTQESQSQDIIFLDAYNGSEIPFHLTSKEFFELANEKLSDKGILIINYLGKVNGDERLNKFLVTITEIYPCVKLFAVNPRKSLKQNILFVASRRGLDDFFPREASPIQITS